MESLIRRHSRQLDRTLRELKMPQHRGDFEKVFGLAIKHGGLAERDFERDCHASYNPRSARIPYILVYDCKCKDPAELMAGMLAAVCEIPAESYPLPSLPQGVAPLLVEAKTPPQQFIARGLSPAAARISASVRLDRARHLHLCNNEKKLPLWQDFWEETKQYLPIAEAGCPRLVELLEAWLERWQKRLDNLG